jgi:hypothetical protein
VTIFQLRNTSFGNAALQYTRVAKNAYNLQPYHASQQQLLGRTSGLARIYTSKTTD